MKLELMAGAAFGLEAVVRREVEALGYRVLKTEDGRVRFLGDERAVVRANLRLRCSDRVAVVLAEFTALEFEDLFQQVKGIAWEEWIPPDGNIKVNASSVKSKLSSVPAIQSVAEKALLSRLSEVYGIERFPKSGADFSVKLSFLKDSVLLTLDTTGRSLHRRGYRKLIGRAPLKETTAAALISLSFWKPGRLLFDPCCGSGTLAIEAAMMALNIAPGISRSFSAEGWDAIDKELWKEERSACYKEILSDSIDAGRKLIYASDIDGAAIKIARENAEEAGVSELIHFERKDISKMRELISPKDGEVPNYGVVVTNPPYGERIGDKETLDHIYASLRTFFRENESWSLFALSSDKEFEKKTLGRPADRRRKLYNGRLEVCYYQFHGQKTTGD